MFTSQHFSRLPKKVKWTRIGAFSSSERVSVCMRLALVRRASAAMSAMASAHAAPIRLFVCASRLDHGPGASTRPSSSLRPFARSMRAPSTAAAVSALPRAAASSSSTPPLAVGDEVEVECTALAFGGRGVCRLESGFVLLCDRATPGETVVARVTGVKKGGRFAEAAKVRTVAPSPHAVESPCPHFAKCGGCTWQDVAYPAQLDMKRVQVLDVLRRTAKVSPRDVVSSSSARALRIADSAGFADALVPPTLPAPSTAQYRNKMEFAFAPPLELEEIGERVPAARLGLRPPGDHAAVVEVTSADGAGPGCLLQHPLANAVLASAQAHLRTHEGAAAALPAFDRRTGAGVLRSLTVRVSSPTVEADGRYPEKNETDEGLALAAVNVAACVSSDPEGTMSALRALAESIATAVPGVRSVTHTAVAAEPELRRAPEGRGQGWVRGGRGGRGGKRRGPEAFSRLRRRTFGSADVAAETVPDGVTVLHGASTLRMRLRGLTFDLSPRSFFQTNSAQAERLVDAVEAACGFEARENEKVVLDLFCGAGALGLSVAHRARRVVGWEVVPEAVHDAIANAAANGIANATFRVGDLTKLERLAAAEGRGGGSTRKKEKNVLFDGGAAPDVIICDPARAGMSGELVRALRKIGAERIVYVSCNPATQARDLARFFADENENASGLTGHRYRLRSIEPVDMFPNTPHVETVAVLLRADDERRDAVDGAT